MHVGITNHRWLERASFRQDAESAYVYDARVADSRPFDPAGVHREAIRSIRRGY